MHCSSSRHRIPGRLRAHPQASQSGVGVNDDCLNAYNDLKMGRSIKYIIFTIGADNKEIVVEKRSTSANYDEFLADLPEAEPRWAVYDFEFTKEGAGKRNKLTFFSWCVPSLLARYRCHPGARWRWGECSRICVLRGQVP